MGEACFFPENGIADEKTKKNFRPNFEIEKKLNDANISNTLNIFVKIDACKNFFSIKRVFLLEKTKNC
jgi:hypothetical protein